MDELKVSERLLDDDQTDAADITRLNGAAVPTTGSAVLNSVATHGLVRIQDSFEYAPGAPRTNGDPARSEPLGARWVSIGKGPGPFAPVPPPAPRDPAPDSPRLALVLAVVTAILALVVLLDRLTG